ncbi:M48 family metallopeptidase [Paenibacillus sp. R14(2021)]|uniref:M48 family metallopeptidase n=1 Tax=Paenibacillus sp. R14(2021) TaxID=2859228 RepID=UPI001C612DE9|nr:M48 family metallopeptidase [Paenibacillus sp. R14(2021)]
MQTQEIPVSHMVSFESCPQCGKQVPKHWHYPSWCECGWNLKAFESITHDRFAAAYLRLGRKLGSKLLRDMMNEKGFRPRLTKNKLATMGFATLIHGITATMAVGACVLIIKGIRGPYYFDIIIGLIAALAVWFSAPRLPKLEMDGVLLSREENGALYGLVDEVSDYMKLPRIDGLIIDHRYNASYQQAGWRMKRYVTLGLPLFCILSSEEKVALISHEIAHGVNQDSLSGHFTLTAYRTLLRWSELMDPQDAGEIERNLTVLISRYILGLLSYVPWLLANLYIHLYFYESQKSEYLADYKSAEVGGTDAALGLAEKMYGAQTFRTALQRHVLNQHTGSFFDAYKGIVDAMPDRERERIRRIELLEGSRLHYTHPPSAYRLQFMQHHYHASAGVRISDEHVVNLETELKELEPRMQKKLILEFQDQLYW